MFAFFQCRLNAARRGLAKRRVRAAFVPRSGTNALRGEAAQLHAAAAGGCVRAHAPRRVFAFPAVIADGIKSGRYVRGVLRGGRGGGEIESRGLLAAEIAVEIVYFAF